MKTPQLYSASSVVEDTENFMTSRIAPISLKKEIHDAYQTSVFPTTSKQGVGGANGLKQVIQNIMMLSGPVNAMLSLTRILLDRGARLEDMPEDAQQAEIKSIFKQIQESVALGNDVQTILDNAMGAMCAGTEHVIKPSTRYKGGYDVMFCGLPHAGGASIRPIRNASIVIDRTNSLYEEEAMSNYQTPLSLRLMKAVRAVMSKLLDNKISYKTAHKRQFVQLPLLFNFEELNTIFKTESGLNIDLGFKNLPNNVSVIGEFYSVLICIEPMQDLYAAWRRYLVAKKDNPNADKPNNEELISPEGLYLGTSVSFSFALNFRKEVCQYICQSEQLELIHYCIDTMIRQWARIYVRPKGLRGSEKKGRGNYARMPRFVIPTHKVAALKRARLDSGMHVDEGRVNDAGLTVDPKGRIIYMPTGPESENLDVAKDYENAVDALLRKIYEADAPLLDTDTLNSKYLIMHNENLTVDSDVKLFKDEVAAYSGALLSFSWDYNTILSCSGTSVAFDDLLGATPPDDLIIADALGFDFKEEGERSQQKTIKQFMHESGMDGRDEISSESLIGRVLDMILPTGTARFAPVSMIAGRRFLKLFDTYAYYARKGKLPSLGELVGQTLEQQKQENESGSLLGPLDVGIYRTMFDEQMALLPGLIGGFDGGLHEGHVVMGALLAALSDATGHRGSNLFRVVAENVGADNAGAEVQDHPAYLYINDKTSRMADFGNVYNYFGGRLFRNMCAAILTVDTKSLFFPKRSAADVENNLLPSFSSLSQDVMPLAVMFSKYIPNYLEYFSRAEQIYESNMPDESIDVDNIVAPGIVSGAKVFPHQVKAHKSLRRRPKYAILDVHPGGGKTATGILDILACSEELHAMGQRLFAVVVAPDKLCKNWAEDTAMLTNGNWNVIPITTVTFEEWGPERLTDLIKNAPRNTFLAVGINFLKSKPYSVMYGPRRVKALGGVEFIKQFNPNYVLMDESHKAKKFDPESNHVSVVHKAVKEVFTMDGIQFARLATGTLVHDVLTDVVGQSALLTSYIYKTPKTSGIDMKAEDGPLVVRSKLSKYAAVITLKRKEWAFMLPNPIDIFIDFDLDEGGHAGNLLHSEVYQALLKQTLEDLENAVKNKRKTSSEDGDDETDDETSDGEEGGGDLDMDDNDELASLGSIGLQTYLQAVEQLVTDPWGESAFRIAADAAGIKKFDFMPAKIGKVIERLDTHFTVGKYTAGTNIAPGAVVDWERGMIAREYDVVRYNGAYYMRRPLPIAADETAQLARKETPPSDVSPDKDTENWKPEMRGKVIVFCRYTRCVDAIFEHLPPKYKARARRFHGEVGRYGENKWQNLDDFANDPNVDILVANEQAIAEGHNLQMGSRIIRSDTPWSPGDLEQSGARIFRPDPKAAKVENGKPGDMAREVIYNDWLMTNNTTEVAKVARLMWKTVDKTKFDEKGNPRYEPINGIVLDRIPMSLETLRDLNTMGDFMDYFQAKATLATIERQEFTEMRRTTVAQMIDLNVPAIPSDFKRMEQFPIMPNQRIPDPDGWGLVRFREWVKNTKGFVERMDELMNLLPVRTGFGTGVVTGYTINYVTIDGERVPDPVDPISNVKIRYRANDEELRHRIDNVFVATKANPSNYDRFFTAEDPYKDDKSKKRIEKSAEREEKEVTDMAEARATKRKSNKETGEQVVRTSQRKTIRKSNKVAGKPVNDGVEKVKRVKPVKDGTVAVNKVVPVAGQKGATKTVPTKDMKLKLHPSVYNGFISIHATNNDPDSLDLKKFGFIPHGEFAYCDFKNYRHFDKFIDFIEAKFQVTPDTEKRIEKVMDVFEDSGRMGFDAKQALEVQSKLPNFFRTRKQEATDKKSFKAYPVVLHDRLRIVVDLATNPVVRKVLGNTIPGTTAKWQLHPGMTVFFAATKRQAKDKLRELTKAGYVITNVESVVEALDSIR
jgi:hypothetical protein